MKWINTVFITLLMGCITTEKTHKSNWYGIDKAEKLECQKWPLREKDLRIESVKPTLDHTHVLRGFAVTVLTRTANRAFYFMPFKNEIPLDLDHAVPVVLPRQTLFLGAILQGKKRFIVTAQNGLQGIQLELRTLGDNVVRAKGGLPGERIEDGRIVRGGQGLWLRFSTPEGIEKIAQIRLFSNDQWDIRLVPGTYETPPVLIPQQKGLYTVWKEEAKNPLRFRWIPLDGPVGNPQEFPYTPDQQIESWTAGTDGSRFYAVVVDGDTLIGQASLKLLMGAMVSNVYNIEKVHKLNLRNVHATEPSLVHAKGQTEALLMNWIDEESTIARYTMMEDTVPQPRFSGIFPKGTKIQETMRGNERSFFLAKNKVEAQWNIYLCEL